MQIKNYEIIDFHTHPSCERRTRTLPFPLDPAHILGDLDNCFPNASFLL